MRMKLKIIVVLLVAFLFTTLTACDGLGIDFTLKIENVVGVSDIKVNSISKEISFTVSPEVNNFDLSRIETGYDTISITSFDDGKKISLVDLIPGENEFVIVFSGEVSYLGTTYEIDEQWNLTINKLLIATLCDISIEYWNTTYYVDSDFEKGRLMLIYSDDSKLIIDLTLSMVVGFSTSTPGDFNVVIEYNDISITTTISVLPI